MTKIGITQPTPTGQTIRLFKQTGLHTKKSIDGRTSFVNKLLGPSVLNQFSWTCEAFWQCQISLCFPKREYLEPLHQFLVPSSHIWRKLERQQELLKEQEHAILCYSKEKFKCEISPIDVMRELRNELGFSCFWAFRKDSCQLLYYGGITQTCNKNALQWKGSKEAKNQQEDNNLSHYQEGSVRNVKTIEFNRNNS